MDFLAPMSFLFLLAISAVTGYSTGPPSEACSSMIPNHGGLPAQPAASSPYMVLTNQKTYTPGETVSVTITGGTFKGFFLQARTVIGDKHVGTFTPIANTKAIMCDENTAVSHATALPRSSITLDWSPPNLDEDIQIFATVVQQFTTFWVKIEGPVLSREPWGSLAEVTVESYRVSWTAPVNNKIEFTVSGNVGNAIGNKYVAVGFSPDESMGNDSVVDCIEKGANGDVSVQASYNEGKANLVNPAGNAGLQLTSGSRINGILKCVFQRDVSRAGDSQFFDLFGGVYHIFVTSGDVGTDDIKKIHSLEPTHRPVMSAWKIDFMSAGRYRTHD